MTLEERRERHGALLAGIKKHDAAAWSQSFLEYLKRVRSTDGLRRQGEPGPEFDDGL